MLDYPILIALIVFAATTIFYIILYRRIVSRGPEPRAPRRHELDEGELSKLRDILPRRDAELEMLLSELKEIRRRAELLLDEGGNPESEGGGDKGSPEGDQGWSGHRIRFRDHRGPDDRDPERCNT